MEGRSMSEAPKAAVVLPYWSFWEATVGGPTFREDRLEALGNLVPVLTAAGVNVVWHGLVDSVGAGEAAGSHIKSSSAEVVLVVQSMAVPPAYVMAGLERAPDIPIVIWAAQDGTIMRPEFDASDITRSGATVGTPMLTNVLGRHGRPYELVVGAMAEDATISAVVRVVRAGAVAGALRTARIARVGVPLDGYACVDVDDDDLMRATGIELVEVHPAEVRSLYERATDIDELVTEVNTDFDITIADPDALTRSLRLAAAMEALDTNHSFAAGAMNCHVEEIRFGDDPGVTPCFGIGRETTRGIPWTCTGDVVTAVAMLMVKRLSGAALYHEIEAIDFTSGEVAIANSGEHDLSWCDEGCRPRLQSNPWFSSDPISGASAWFELPPGPATLVGFTPHHAEPSGFRFIAAEGTVTDRSFPRSPTIGGAFRFAGDQAVDDVWKRWATAGVNHHSAIGPGHFADQVEVVANLVGVGHVRVS